MVHVATYIASRLYCVGYSVIKSVHTASGTSDSGPFEIGTLYNKPLYKGHCLRSQKLHSL